MTSQRVERTWIRTGGYGRFRGEWVKCECLPLLPFQGNSFVIPPPPQPVVSPLSLLLINRPSYSTPLFSAVLSLLTQATTKIQYLPLGS